MFGFISGYSDTDEIHYCPACGAEIVTTHADGTGTCDKCGRRFGVIVTEDRNDNKNDSEA